MAILGNLEDLYPNATTILVAVTAVVAYALYRSARRPEGFPPGPTALPLFGNTPVFFFGKSAQHVFQELWDKYGAIYSLKFYSGDMIVLNTIEVVKEALIKKAVDFSGRPRAYSLSLFTQGYKDIVFSEPDAQWRYQRKLGHTALRHFGQREQLANLVFDVTPGAAKILDELGDEPFAPKCLIGQIVVNILSTLCFAKRYEFNQPDLLHWINTNKEMTKAFGNGLPADFLTIFQYIPTPAEINFKRALKPFLQMFYDEFEKHRQTFDPENVRDLLDSLLLTQKESIEAGEEEAYDLTDTHLVQTVTDIFGAGMETSTVTLHWAVLLMTEHPDIQEKVAAEIDDVVGRDRMPSLDDRCFLPFTEATILEIFRYGTMAPMGVPRAVREDTTLCGYKIPKGTTVLINQLALHYNPDKWEEPEKFKPERFLNDNGQLFPKPPENLLPFGTGRRLCLGEDFTKKEVFLLFAWLCNRYTFYKVPGKEETVLKLCDFSFSHQPLEETEVCVKKRF